MNGIGPRRVEQSLESVGLAERADEKVNKYSLGMRQRLGLGAALLKDPALLVLDEPVNGLDPAGIREIRQMLRRLGAEAPELVDATGLATTLLGDSIMGNLFMLGYAWQKGWVPLSLDALIRAIELNGAAIEQNRAAFNWGRLAAHDIAAVLAATGKNSQPDLPDALALGGDSLLDDRKISSDLETVVARRVAFLTQYQDAAYAQKYKNLVDQVRGAEAARLPGALALTEAVARYAFKLMAYKDEYEVAPIPLLSSPLHQFLPLSKSSSMVYPH